MTRDDPRTPRETRLSVWLSLAREDPREGWANPLVFYLLETLPKLTPEAQPGEEISPGCRSGRNWARRTEACQWHPQQPRKSSGWEAWVVLRMATPGYHSS